MIGLSSCGHEHVVEKIEKINATCTETGLTEGKICSTCGEILVAQKEIPAKGHNYVKGVCTSCKKEDPNMKAYDKLTDKERKIFDVLIMNIKSFNNPSEVRILSVYDMDGYGSGRTECYLKIKGTNKVGGAITKWYNLVYDSYTWKSDSGTVYNGSYGTFKVALSQLDWPESKHISVSGLNKAIVEYLEEQGLV